MRSRIWYEIRLELGQIHVESAIEPQRSRGVGNRLGRNSVHVEVSNLIQHQPLSADILEGGVVHHETTVDVLDAAMHPENGVVDFCW